MHIHSKGKPSLHDGFSSGFLACGSSPHGLPENPAVPTEGAFYNQSIKLAEADPSLLLPTPGPETEDPTDPTMSSEPGAPPAVPPLHSPKSPVWPTFPFQREGSRVWERGNLLLRDLPSPLPTKRTRTYSATARASAGPIYKGVCKQFSRSQGHGFITPENGTEDIFVHVSDIEGEYVPVEGDEVTYKVCPIPPKNQKFQAVEVVLTNLAPHTKHETWSGQIIGS
ncbi:cold shock domain-containing protein C2 isoform X1 [Gallus gallus]|uniref:Cold shock domain containing C2 n=1 Tax=Gallus gallus TaxID=9031 RepID=A0A8V0YF87_CHICK|nr:cold shock domain-containing protein C2 isoform X1 [Gallus gallus]